MAPIKNNFRKYLSIASLVPLSALFIFFKNSSSETDFALNAPDNNGMVSVGFVDPLYKVLSQEKILNYSKGEADAAGGEIVTFQLVVKSDEGDIQDLSITVTPAQGKSSALREVKVGFLGYVKINTPINQKTTKFNYANNGLYPDPILNSIKTPIKSGSNQPIWISIQIPINQNKGVYNGKVSISGKVNNISFEQVQNYTVNVYDVSLQQNNFWVSNWWANGQNVSKYFGGQDVIGKIARKMAENKINSFIINSLESVKFSKVNGTYKFNFSTVGWQIDTFLKAGVNKRIEGIFLAKRSSADWRSPYYMRVPQENSNGNWGFVSLPLSDNRVKQFYGQYLPAQVNFLKEKKVYNIYYQHIADEPSDANVDSYNQILHFVKSLDPGIKTIDAVQTDKVSSELDVIMPLLDILSGRYNSFKQLQGKSEIGFYTCWLPQGDYANRLIEMNLIKNRFIPWIAFRYNLSGYLHWGFNQWSNNDPLTNLDKNAGDSWIVYPEDGQFISSIRLEALRDGINDYALLKQLSDKKPEVASEIAKKEIMSFNSYDLNINDFRETRKLILKSLEQ